MEEGIHVGEEMMTSYGITKPHEKQVTHTIIMERQRGNGYILSYSPCPLQASYVMQAHGELILNAQLTGLHGPCRQ